MTKKDTVNFEASLNKLEQIVAKLENGDISLEDSVKSFEESVIFYSNEENDPNPSVKELAEKYRYTPEFRAMEEIGIPTKRYCCRRMFLCHPRELGNVIV